MPIKFVLIRHGEAQHNSAFREMGESAYEDEKYKNAVLTDTGVNQCNESGETLSASYEKFDICYSSPLKRCIQTGLLIKQWVPIDDYLCTDDLIERSGGGHICNVRGTKSEIEAEFGELGVRCMPTMTENPTEWYVREPLRFVEERIVCFLRDMLKIYAGANVNILIVTHHDVLYALLAGTSIENADFVELDEEEMELLVASENKNEVEEENDTTGK